MIFLNWVIVLTGLFFWILLPIVIIQRIKAAPIYPRTKILLVLLLVLLFVLISIQLGNYTDNLIHHALETSGSK